MADPAFRGFVETTLDALLVLEGCRRGFLPKITRRLQESPSEVSGPTAFYQMGCIATGEPIPDLSDDKVAQEIVLIATGQKQPEEKPVAEQDNEEPYPQIEDKA